MITVKRITILAVFLLVIGIIGMAATFSTYKESASYEETESIPFDANELEEIEVDAKNTQIRLHPANGEEPRAEYTATGRKTETQELDTSNDGEKLGIQIEENFFPFFHVDFMFQSHATLDIFIPANMMEKIHVQTTNSKITASDLQINELQLHTSNGRIEGENLETPSLHVQSSNGRIVLNDVQGDVYGKSSNSRIMLENIIGQVTAHTSNGKIELNSIEGDTTAETTNGKVEAQHISGEMNAKTNNAAINIETVDFNYPMDLQTSNGKITIISEQEPENATFDLRTNNGTIRVFDSKEWDITYGNGDTLIKAHTSNGGITIE
ncbi:DUF4097 family beta strand repeat-containing protein [Oceanobacillus timonensis]|uniref:DUF4097 family beta strand repeat-containing protein n=1 Tax=Oceanobacillus timonensis TaxID=1926285 RepID=UPI0009BAD119|nr:DUF4097 family beta strand repeat-containing protein [Oceanobacillus timonensis]